MKLLLVEDEAAIAETLTEFLLGEHFLVSCASDYNGALDKLMSYEYDCVLLDLMIPGGDGLSLLEYIRSSGKRLPVIILSAKGTVDDRILGLNTGADDYLAKPFDLVELLARIKSAVRRYQQPADAHLGYKNVALDPMARTVLVAGNLVVFNRKEYDILNYFLLRPNKLVQKSLLAESIWGDDVDQLDNFDFIYSQVKNIRKKLKDAGAEIDLKAVYGVGYKLV